MKRLWTPVLLFVFCFALVLPVYATPKVILDNNYLTFDVPPQIESGRTLVPLRAIFEALGATVEWDASTQTVTATKDGTTVKLQIGSKIAYKNGSPVPLDVPGKIHNGRTLVPLRFVSEAMGASVEWKADTQTIIIKRKENSQVDVSKPTIMVQVTRVIDGDTIEVNMQGKTEKVRLIGIDTPETVHPEKEVEYYGKEASNFTKSKLESQQVELEFDVQERDKYGRLLAYVWLNGQLFNEILVKEGYAKVSTYPPNVKYVDKFTVAQKEAREQGRGLWGEKTAQQPASQPAKTSGNYVGSLKSDKYHLPSCRWAKEISKENQIWFDTKEEAKKAGYKPCGVCKP